MPPKRKTKSGSTAKNAASNKEDQAKRAKLHSHPFKDHVEKLYGMPMSDDLFLMQQFFSKDDSNKDALTLLKLKCVGPFLHLSDKQSKTTSSDPTFYHMQWRYFYDVPEFLTAFASTESNNLFHIGYFRDDPSDLDSLVVASNTGKDAKLTLLGDNLFAAISTHTKEVIKTIKTQSKKKKLTTFLQNLQDFAKESNLDLTTTSNKVNERKKKVVTQSFHGLGIVVPLSKDGIGYRPLHHTDAQLKRLLQKIVNAKNDQDRIAAFDPIQETVNFIQFANDECDYGMGLELGIDLFCHGSKYFHKMSNLLLTVGYQLLKRDLYAKICDKHLADRREKDVERA
uniref:UPF0609 protein C4orf27 homolog n=1 Tax=Phallusia mammillata TaxID=59560 RepID=A0A6F9DEM3_9ASCI|nr:UPF0609 protein C4orf27 homolog [Phallusia mammillata]